MTRNPIALASFVAAFFLASPAALGAEKPVPVAVCSTDILKVNPLPMVVSPKDSGGARGEQISFNLLPTPADEDATETAKSDAALEKIRAEALIKCLHAKAVKDGKQPKLLLNGVPMAAGAKLVNRADWWRGEITYELVTELPSDASKEEKEAFADFWKSIYREGKSSGTVNSRAELQIEGTGTIAASAKEAIPISGSPKSRRITAIVTAFVIIALFCWALGSNRVFRDKAPDWIDKAHALLGIRKTYPDMDSFLVDQAAALKVTVTELKRNAEAQFSRAVEDATQPNAEESKLAAIGLLVSGAKIPEVSYSLSRVQLGAWLILTIMGALLIWVYQGGRPAIPVTYLALLGISGGTRLLSDVVDSSKQNAVGGIHKGFFADLTAGTNGGGVHRYQALMINIVLLATVAFEIFGTLAFPEIEDSWLLLLTGSSTVYLAAKKSGETPPVKD